MTPENKARLEDAGAEAREPGDGGQLGGEGRRAGVGGGAHFVMLDQPEVFATAVAAFFASK